MTEKQKLALQLGREKGLKRNRPKGLKYNLVKINPTSFKKGQKAINPFRKGHKVWNEGLKGIHLSLNTEFKKGQKGVWKDKQRLDFRGKNHPNWRGGKSKQRHIDLERVEYKLWRKAVFEKDNYTCQKCEKRGGYLQADHIKEWADYPELRYVVSNGQALCLKCHRIKTAEYMKNNKNAKKL